VPQNQSTDVENWLVSEMTQFPGMTKEFARGWLKDGRVAALLDGLDEFNDDRRADLARALNGTLLHECPDMAIVICSRTSEYEALKTGVGTQLELQGSVELQPLSGEQITEYLAAANSPLTKSSLADSVLSSWHGGNQRWRWGGWTRFRMI
jgi:predicted NACHT family NTPase